MNTKNWNHLRSEFNHSWLKNRFLLTLRKAHNVVAGAVIDDTIWCDLAGLLDEWEERRSDALMIINEYFDSANPVNELNKLPVRKLDIEFYNWLFLILDNGWKATSNPASRLTRATLAFEAFDQEARSCSSKFSNIPSDLKLTNIVARLSSFQEKAKEMACAFSELAPS